MASKKEASAVDAVLDYLKAQNRPYSVNDIVLNLHKEHGKTAVQKALDKLVQDEQVREKTYGKQKVYVISQSILGDTFSADEIKAMDKRIEEKETAIKGLDAQMKESQAELRHINSSMTTEQMIIMIAKLTEENAALSEKRDKFASANVEVLEKSERDKIRTNRARILGQWRARKKMGTSILEAALEGWPGSKADLIEEVGIELDEAVGAVLPSS
ncbi:homologous-pairing protein 2 homolog [Folsomia candida]|uniref:Homologous-pairing protein 2 n=1 Tax=Folsomia candida TaxID=158441 RepID=A0A226E0I2_FOLCA|nr:homologous-pairing protein 2 homolog [Folsomia candida]OXA51232.1 Homologous-pairing protein 2 [Folsomia candida]